MSLPVVPRKTAFLPKGERFEVFGKYARYQPEHSRSGSDRYAICVGSHDGGTMFAPGTLDLYVQFNAWALRQRREKRESLARPWRVHDGFFNRCLGKYFKTKEAARREADRLNSRYCVRYVVRRVR